MRERSVTDFVPDARGIRKKVKCARVALQTLLHSELLGTAFQFLALGKDASRESLIGFTSPEMHASR